MQENVPVSAKDKPRLGFRAGLLCATSIAAATPLAVAAVGGGAAAIAVAALVGVGAVGFTAHRLRRLEPIARTLGGWAGEVEPARGDLVDPDRMQAQVARIAAELDAFRRAPAPDGELASRSGFLAKLAESLQGEPGVLGVVKFGDFKGLAAFDPPAADHALTAFAERLSTSVAAHRLIGRVGRDSFAIWISGVDDVTELQALSYVLSQDIAAGDFNLSPHITIGAAIYPRDADDAERLLARAELALSDAGRSAPGKPAFASAEASSSAKHRFELSQDLRRALQRNQFSLHYQPVVDLRQSKVIGAEALLRWTHPVLGRVSPAEFVPILEQSGLMEEVGLWVLNAACRQTSEWRKEGLGDITVAVNLSTVQCRHPQLGSLVMRTLERHGLEPHHLELELTETAAMEDGETTRKLLTELKSLGVRVAIDDFGAGYSSLTYLKNLPFSKLKIDREFVTNVDQRVDSQAICSALVALARGLDIDILAEGVERREELETLRGLGCPLIQGYYFAQPMPPQDFARKLSDPEWLELLASPVHRQRALVKPSIVQ